MTVKEWFKEFKFFIRYLVKRMFEDCVNIYRLINSPKTWMYLSVALYGLSKWKGWKFADIFILILAFCFLWLEYIAGNWRHEYKGYKLKQWQEKAMHQNISPKNNSSENTEKKT